MAGEEFDEESRFCSDCTDDYWLKDKIGRYGIMGLCSVCKNEAGITISFHTLAEWLEAIWREWFHPGEDVPVFSENSDRIEYDQRGDDPYLLINELLRCCSDEEAVTLSVMALMGRGDHYEIMQGGDALLDECTNYQRRDVPRYLVDQCWRDFVVDLKHHTRYFNQGAIRFFDKLFEDLGEVHTYVSCAPFVLSAEKKSVIQQYEPGSLAIYRARKAGDQNTLKCILNEPDTELTNPPDYLAAEGRMNPKGISYFYGAQDRVTCVAELRPSLGEKAVSSEFELIAPVQLLDLTLLAEGLHARSESLFDENYPERRIHRKLLSRLHWLIAQPVVSGADLEYLPTQAMAEYLARRNSPRIDGIIFESVQRKDGRNIVLFPHVLNKTNHSANDFIDNTLAIQIKPNTLVLHETTRIEYGFEERMIVDGEIEYLDKDLQDDYEYEHFLSPM